MLSKDQAFGWFLGTCFIIVICMGFYQMWNASHEYTENMKQCISEHSNETCKNSYCRVLVNDGRYDRQDYLFCKETGIDVKERI